MSGSKPYTPRDRKDEEHERRKKKVGEALAKGLHVPNSLLGGAASIGAMEAMDWLWYDGLKDPKDGDRPDSESPKIIPQGTSKTAASKKKNTTENQDAKEKAKNQEQRDAERGRPKIVFPD